MSAGTTATNDRSQSVPGSPVTLFHGKLHPRLVQPLGELTGLRRVQRRYRVPVVLTVDEVARVLNHMTCTSALMAVNTAAVAGVLIFHVRSWLQAPSSRALRIKSADEIDPQGP